MPIKGVVCLTNIELRVVRRVGARVPSLVTGVGFPNTGNGFGFVAASHIEGWIIFQRTDIIRSLL